MISRLNTIRKILFSRSTAVQARLDNAEIVSLLDAIEANDVRRLLDLLKWFGDVDVEMAHGWTCLHSAAEKNRPEIIRQLIDRGANSERLGTPLSCTALQVAIDKYSFDSADALLHGGADIDGRSGIGRTALHFAISADRFKVGKKAFEYVMGRNPNIDAADEDGVTPVDMVIDYGDDGDLVALLTRGADPNTRIGSQTRLHRLAQGGLPARYYRILIEWGANIHARDGQGRLAFDIAKERGLDASILQLLSIQHHR